MSAMALEHRPSRSAENIYRPRLARVLEAREEIAARGSSRQVVTLAL